VSIDRLAGGVRTARLKQNEPDKELITGGVQLRLLRYKGARPGTVWPEKGVAMASVPPISIMTMFLRIVVMIGSFVRGFFAENRLHFSPSR
jgi:hypothetical protein